MHFLKIPLNLILRFFYNRKFMTNILSSEASLKAQYGKGVLISKGTKIANDVIIGNYSYVNTDSWIENCQIGKFCSISSNVWISPAEHHLEYITTHPIIQDIQENRQKVIIGNDVLISLNVIILEGITIGDGAVIGAGAVVTKDVMPFEVVGGVPARHLRYRFSDQEILEYQSLQWWEWPIEKIIRNKRYLRREFTSILSSEADDS